MSELLKAVAEVLKAIAWPTVVILAGLTFKDQLRALIERLRKLRDLEFGDPATVQIESSCFTLFRVNKPGAWEIENYRRKLANVPGRCK